MGIFSHYPLQSAIYSRLVDDVTLSGLISGVFDRPPQGTAFPYITLGESSVSDWSSKTTSGTSHMLSMHIWSREGGRKQTAVIMERIYAVLHQVELTVEDHTLILIRFASSTILLDNDGFTYHGIMRFEALLEADQ